MFPPEIQKVISTYLVFGFIPMDKLLHFIVGAILAVGLRLSGRTFKTMFIVIGVIAVIKEVIDSFTMNSFLREHSLDILVTFIYPTLMYGIHRLKVLSAHSN